MTSTSKLDEITVNDISRDVLIFLIDKGRKVVIKDSDEDLSETIVQRLPLNVMSNQSLIEELGRIVGVYDGSVLSIEKVQSALGPKIFHSTEILEISILIASKIVEEIRRKYGLIIDLPASGRFAGSILIYRIKTNNDIGSYGSIEMGFDGDHVSFEIWKPFDGKTHHSVIEYADPRFNADGIVKHILEEIGEVSIDSKYELKMLRQAQQHIEDRVKEWEKENG